MKPKPSTPPIYSSINQNLTQTTPQNHLQAFIYHNPQPIFCVKNVRNLSDIVHKCRVKLAIIQCHLKSIDIKLANNKTSPRLHHQIRILVVSFYELSKLFRLSRKLPTMQPQSALSSVSLIKVL
jgi:hypothetical protein